MLMIGGYESTICISCIADDLPTNNFSKHSCAVSLGDSKLQREKRLKTKAPWRICKGSRVVFLLCALVCWRMCGTAQAEPVAQNTLIQNFELHGGGYPLLLVGETIGTKFDIEATGFFKPLFGPERPIVNPAVPRILGRRKVVFEQPGEYYLRFNGTVSLKVLVLDPSDSISLAVLRVFDFASANLVACPGNDGDWAHTTPEQFIAAWFSSEEAVAVSCGPTANIFIRLIQDRFMLPGRVVTFPGTYLLEGKVAYATHNVPEIYLPDKKKFVLFDLNLGLVVKYKNAGEMARVFHDILDDEAKLANHHFDRLGFHVHDGPHTFVAKEGTCESRAGFRFLRGYLSEKKVRDQWYYDASKAPGESTSFAPLYYGGVAYFGQPGYGTEFLGEYVYGTLHHTRFLGAAAVKWVESYGLKVRKVRLEDLERLLERGHAREVAEANARLVAQPWGAWRKIDR